MRKWVAAAVAAIAYWLARLAACLPDAAFLLLIGWAKRWVSWRKPADPLNVVLGDVEKIFKDPASSALARRMIREARPAQFKAVVRGDLL
ncbi:MAG: hypothetical protein C4523_16795 [Myxococcales bacterium]|nr:MAG: hypothetical protein C4523_16795 [Myxococcales bacterium]